MIRIHLRFDDTGSVVFLKSGGHAGFGAKGADIVCSAVTSAVRTFCRLAESADGVESAGGVKEDGTIQMEIPGIRADRLEWFRGVSDSLVCALSDLSAGHPEHVSLDIRRGTGRE